MGGLQNMMKQFQGASGAGGMGGMGGMGGGGGTAERLSAKAKKK